MSAYFGKNFCTSLPVFTRFPNFFGSWKYDLSGLWYVCDIIPSWYGDFSSNSKSIFGLTSVLLSIFGNHKFSGGLEGGLYIRSG